MNDELIFDFECLILDFLNSMEINQKSKINSSLKGLFKFLCF